ncbi:MAG: glycosyltransferase [Selenomonadaceae bacterium]|nr:glycosyltransferase [Selenomonadaceae bacterium]
MPDNQSINSTSSTEPKLADENSTEPAVSVIIPMYNAEKYISECLDSILAQTFQDFEVIVVDDCSSDSSCEIIESYMPKFDGRLKLARTEENSGGGGYVPRNVGLKQASGEYIFFVDADDFILLTTLETLYTAAKENDTDVIYTSAFYKLTKPNDVYFYTDGLGKTLLKEGIEDKPTLVIDNPNKILDGLLINKSEEHFRNPWSKFVRRDFLLENDIAFPETLKNGGDFIWVIHVYCCAKRFLRISTPLYFYRSYSSASVSRTRRAPSEQVSYWISGFVKWLNVLNELTNRVEILRDNPAYSLGATRGHFDFCINIVIRQEIKKLNLSNQDIYKMIYGAFVNRDDLADFVMPFVASIIDKSGKVVDRSLQTFDTLTEEIKQFKKSQAPFQLDANVVTKFSADSPAISVIIPMYNVEEYISECLDSLLAQTLRNFEIIIADDCSTDSSCEIIESYMPKFEGRLRLTHTETNSGGCAVPRNVGLPLARGEYVYFMDSDDVLTQTGLEEMYTLAKEYDADVVYCERYYMSEGIGEDLIKNMYVAKGRVQSPPYVEEATLEPEDLAERVQRILENKYWATAWLKLVQRDLLDKHQIIFSHVKPGEDDIWTYSLIFFAKKFLRVPNMVYVRRMRENSIMGTARTPQQEISFWLNPVLFGIKELDKLMGQIKFFQEHPQQRYDILKKDFQARLGNGFKNAEQLTPFDVYETIRNSFGENLGEYDVLISALCTQTFSKDKSLKETQKKLNSVETNKFKDFMSYVLESRSTAPAISVIIPMYNSEKYISECLDSLLSQTFPNFEVIVVDDCSTDSSVAIVNSFISKFDGRLKIISTNKNSGSPGIPRNVGVNLATGEYVCFVDADDFISNSALETLYKAAKNSYTDVVYTSSYYLLQRPNEPNIIRDGLGRKLFKENLEDKQTLTVNDPDKNLRQLVYERNFNFSVMYFVMRDFLVKNQIVFPEIPNGEDHLWTIQVCCYAKRFLRISTPFYFYRRYTGESICTTKREPREQVSYWISTFVLWLKTASEIASKIELLNNNPAYILEAAKRHFDWCLDRTEEERKQLATQDIYEILFDEFSRVNISSNLTVPFFFSELEAQMKTIADTQNTIRRFKPHIAARVDIKFSPKDKGDFQIISVSDKNASVDKPDWFQKDGIGYKIESCAGQLEIVATATAEGQINLGLRGLDILASKESSKRIPYWIDYTNLTINGETIFNKLIPTWHGKVYRYNMEVKKGDQIKIEVKWLPHRSDAASAKKVVAQSLEEQMSRKFMPFITARMEIKLLSKEGDFQMLSVSDKNARVTKPEYLQKGSTCYCVHTYSGKVEMVAKSSVDGQVRLLLRSMEIRDLKDNTKIIYWLDYTNLVINGKTIFDTLTPVWYDKFYGYNIDVKANEEITVQVEWLPHRSDTP